MIFGAFERMVAFRYLRARRQEGFVSVIAIFSLLGIALGVATLIIVMSVMNGFREDLIGRILGLNGHLGVYAAGATMTDFDAMAAKVRAVPGVVGATPLVEGQVMATSEAGAAGALVRGIRPDDIRARKLIADHIVAGSLADFGGDSIVIGDRLASRLGLSVGGKVTLISPEGTDTAFGTVPRMKTYTIAALFDVGFYEYDNSFIYVPLDAAQIFFKMPNAVSYLEVFVARADQSSAIGRAITNALAEPVRILDWQHANSSIVNAVEIERNVMFLILTLIIVVAAFNIISGMIMMVKDKGRDIAILRTMGASRGMVLRIFMLSGASIGVVGTLAGFGLGLAITENLEAIRLFLQNVLHVDLFSAEIYFFTRIPAHIDTGEVTVVVLMALALSFLATLYPSWRAARLDPVEGLRYEMSEPARGPALELRGVRKVFRQGGVELAVLNSVDLMLPPGELVALVGPSGAGKSTLLHLAGLLERPDAGEVRIAGQECGSLGDERRTLLRRSTLGFVYQFHHLLPEFSALENVMLPQMIAGVARGPARDKAAALLERVGLGARLSHRPARLSGGEQQRVAIVRALANDPKVLLADEPTGNLDHTTAESVMGTLIEVTRATGLAALIATHNLELARRLDRIVGLEEGKLRTVESAA